MFLCEFCEIFKNTFFHRTSLVATSACHECYIIYQINEFRGKTAENHVWMLKLPKLYFWVICARSLFSIKAPWKIYLFKVAKRCQICSKLKVKYRNGVTDSSVSVIFSEQVNVCWNLLPSSSSSAKFDAMFYYPEFLQCFHTIVVYVLIHNCWIRKIGTIDLKGQSA